MIEPRGRALAAIAAITAIGLFSRAASAARCGDEARAWVARCAATSGVAMELESCPSGLAIVTTKEVRVELSTSPSALAHAHGYGVTPIGEFPDWKLEPEPRRHAFEAVVGCVAAEAPRALLDADAAAPVGGTAPARIPWLFLVAVALALVACVRSLRATAIAIAAALGVFALRRWLAPFAFFHQNGQGPMWIEFAVRGDAGAYGPGYGEIFGWVARGHRPEQGVALLQETLAATIPLSAFALARTATRSRRSRLVASLVAAALAIDPVLIRIARSESYFSVIAALLFAAAAVLVASDRRCRVVGLVAASLLVAEAARVHPLAWAPAALVALALFARPGRARARLKRVAVAAATIAIVAAPLVLPSLSTSLSSSLGGFLPGVVALVIWRGPIAAALVVLGLAATSWPPARRVRGPVIVVGIVVAAAALTDVLAVDAPVVRVASLHLFAPAAIAAIGALRLRGTAVAVALAAIALLLAERPLVILPTDAREQAWALEWRNDLPPGAEVASLARAGKRLLVLPLAGEGQPIFQGIDDHGVAHFGHGPRFYYRSSICATPDGAPICAAFERAHVLSPIGSRRLPSIASLPWAPLPKGDIDVALFSVAPDALAK